MKPKADQLAFLEAHNIAVMGHSSRSLLEHLVGVSDLLDTWQAPPHWVAAGLFHSVYGTESYKQEALPLDLRDDVRSVIGVPAEALAYTFGAMVKDTFEASVTQGRNFGVVDRHTDTLIHLDSNQWPALCELVVANWLEQRPRVAAEYKLLKAPMFKSLRQWLSEPGKAALNTAYRF